MQLSTQPYKGTRDFYPEDMRIQRAGMATGAPSDLSDTAPLPASDDLFEERPRTTVGTRI